VTAMDPRDSSDDVRPLVGGGRPQMPTWVMVAAMALAGAGLFFVLEGRRNAVSAPSVTSGPAEGFASTAMPPLMVPSVPEPTEPAPASELLPVSPPPQLAPADISVAPAPTVSTVVAPSPPARQAEVRTILPSASDPGSPALVIDTTLPGASAAAPAAEERDAEASVARSARIRQPSTTVLQGTLIPAVLETALDSSRPGQVRAIVASDITGFDGSRILIPRGSRLVGSYEADLSDGQSRAFVEWTRLVRPDGMAIALASPAADLQGRAGVPGRVDRHFLARFGSAVLQTTLNLGAGAAGRSLGGDSSVIVALPGATQNLAPSTSPRAVQPTLHVEAGARVSVFVARDLEFTSGEPR
jgi:type IV secretion system protein VirB10